MPSFGVIHLCTSELVREAGQHIGIFCATDTMFREYLGIVATYVVHNLERFSGLFVNQTVF